MRLKWYFILILVAVLIVSSTSGQSDTTAGNIVGISWQPNGVIQVTFDKFPPELWSNQWEMYIDNNKMPVEAAQGSPNIRPNAELDKNPTGVFIGTLPWLSSLSTTDFPCCGAMKFCIPGKGCTNEVNFDLVIDGCKTASKKNCNSGVQSEAPAESSSEGQSPSGSNVQVMEKMVNPIAGQVSEALVGGSSGGIKLEDNVDRPGMNYKAYTISRADPQLCANDCENELRCKAFTYVRPGVRGPESLPECWLKMVFQIPFLRPIAVFLA
ncbi:MAG: PAN domain-containing protein [Methanotrichaceae archaeon]|nr:PAN domain-containing protein [Methanotrichaceae archaeon]